MILVTYPVTSEKHSLSVRQAFGELPPKPWHQNVATLTRVKARHIVVSNFFSNRLMKKCREASRAAKRVSMHPAGSMPFGGPMWRGFAKNVVFVAPLELAVEHPAGTFDHSKPANVCTEPFYRGQTTRRAQGVGLQTIWVFCPSLGSLTGRATCSQVVHISRQRARAVKRGSKHLAGKSRFYAPMWRGLAQLTGLPAILARRVKGLSS
jgi:hypothetical protein